MSDSIDLEVSLSHKSLRIHTLQELAKYVGGQVAGDPQVEIKGVQPFEAASSEDLTLAAESGYYEQLEKLRLQQLSFLGIYILRISPYCK